MKNNIRLALAILFSCLPISDLGAQQEMFLAQTQPTVSMDFQDARLKDILKVFSIQSGLNFIASEGVQDRLVTLYMDNVPVQEAMDKIFKANNLSYELDEDTSIFIVKDWGKPQIETITKVYTLKYRSVPNSRLEKEKNTLLAVAEQAGNADILASLKQVMSENGKVSEDPRTNSLIITDIPSRFSDIEKVIVSLDIPQMQVMLDVEILDVSKNIVDKLGFEFDENPLTLNLDNYSKFYFGTIATRGATGAVTLGNSFTKKLSYLRTQTDTKYLARPRLLTLNNETAEISITKDEVVGYNSTATTSSGVTTTNLEYIRSTDLALTKEGVGIFLRVTPQINNETNEITLLINPKSSVSSTSSVGDGQADAEVRTTKSIVKVKDGETIILGGLIHVDKQVIEKKLPILGDIPFVGLLFRHKNQTKDVDRELIVFITPHIVRDASAVSAYAKKPVLPGREQSMNLAADRQLAINKSLDNLETVK
ncbi:MAG: secretin N-terminal domain-containing protein [Candidatus Omnitrophota bacterium]